MKILVSLVAVCALAACGGSKKSSSNPNDQAGVGEAEVDRTVPSWTPESCMAYQKAVYQATECDAIEQGKRDEIKSKYDTDAAAWKADQNVDDAKIAAVKAECTTSTESVRAAIGDKCVPPAQ